MIRFYKLYHCKIQVTLFAILMIGNANVFSQSQVITKVADTSNALHYCEIANDFSLNRNFDDAANNFKIAAEIYEEAMVWGRYVQTMNLMSEQYWKVGRYDEAIEIIDPVYKIAKEKLGIQTIETAICYNNLGDIYGIQQQLDESIAYYEKELEIIKNVYGKNHSKVASVYKCIGLSYYYVGDYYKSIEILKKAESILKNSTIVDGILFAKIYTNIGSAYRFLTTYPESSLYYQKAITLYLENEYSDYFLIAFIYQALGNNFAEMQKTELAIICYHQALDLMDKHVEDNSLAKASTYERIGHSYTNMYDEMGIQVVNGKNPVITGLDFYKKAFAIRKDALPMNHPVIGTSLVNIGVTFLYLQNYDSAFICLRRAQRIFNEYDDVYADKLAVCYNNMAGVYNRFERYDSAKYCFQKCLDLHLKVNGNHHSNTIMAYNQLSSTFLNLSDYDTALYYVQKSLQANIRNFNENDPYINPSVDTSISYLFLRGSLSLKAKILTEKYSSTHDIQDLQVALQTLEVAVEASNIEIDKQSFESGKLYYTGEAHNFHARAISLCLKLNEITDEPSYLQKAFVHSEQNRALIMKEAVTNSFVLNQTELSNEVKGESKKMQVQLTILEKQLTVEFDENGLNNMKHINELQNQLISLTSLFNSISEVSNPNKSTKEDNKLPTYDFAFINDFAKVLQDENSAIVEYFMGDSILYIFLVTNRNYIVKAVKFESTKFNVIADYRKSIENRDFISNQPEVAFELYCNTAYQLYQTLFPQEVLSSIGSQTKLYIIPDDILNYISFDALLTRKPDSNNIDYSRLEYLIHQHPISYTYSASFIQNHFEQTNADELYGGFAPIYATNDLASAPELESFAEFRSNPAALKENRNEVEAVANLFRGDVYLAEMADEAAFKNTAQNYNILHFAMHALVNNSDPLYSKLLFSQTQDTIEDNFLNAYEIYNLSLNSSLVVLSACNTGYGVIKAGEGPMSLSRAFMNAGVPSVVSSLWLAHDEVTKNIMLDFFDGINSRLPLNEALRNSKLMHLKSTDPQFAHPYFWANFILIGDHKPIIINKLWSVGRAVNYFGIAVILLISILWLVIKRKKKRSV